MFSSLIASGGIPLSVLYGDASPMNIQELSANATSEGNESVAPSAVECVVASTASVSALEPVPVSVSLNGEHKPLGNHSEWVKQLSVEEEDLPMLASTSPGWRTYHQWCCSALFATSSLMESSINSTSIGIDDTDASFERVPFTPSIGWLPLVARTIFQGRTENRTEKFAGEESADAFVAQLSVLGEHQQLTDAETSATPGSLVWAVLRMETFLNSSIGGAAFMRVGGPVVRAARLMVFAALLVHTGQGAAAAVVCTACGNDETVSLPSPVKDAWRCAQSITRWGVNAKVRFSSSYSDVARKLRHKAKFLLALPVDSAISVDTSDGVGASLDNGSTEDSTRIDLSGFGKRLTLLLRYFTTAVRPSRLLRCILSSGVRAVLSAVGISVVHSLLGAGRNSGLLQCKSTPGLEWLTSDGILLPEARAAIMQVRSPITVLPCTVCRHPPILCVCCKIVNPMFYAS